MCQTVIPERDVSEFFKVQEFVAEHPELIGESNKVQRKSKV